MLATTAPMKQGSCSLIHDYPAEKSKTLFFINLILVRLLDSSRMAFMGGPDLRNQPYYNPFWINGFVVGLFIGMLVGTALNGK